MASKGGLSGLAVAVAAIGGVFVYMGIKDVPLLDGLREFAAGKLPAGREPKKYVPKVAPVGNADGGNTAVGNPAPPGTYKLGLVLPNVSKWAYIIGGTFGIKTIGGWRVDKDFADHPSGRAIDVMINNIPNGMAVGEQIANFCIAHAKEMNLQYFIWNRRSWNPDRNAYAAYTSTGNPHTDHVHITFKG